MTDLGLALGWCAVLAGGIALVVALRRAGLATTYTRDLVHVGAGVWPLGWPWWHGWTVPVAIAVLASMATVGLPWAGGRAARRIREAMSGGDERWSGVALYTVSSAVFTVVAFADAPAPAAAALFALSLGDGVGGAVGRRFGAHRFAAPGGKPKSLEGSATVALMSTAAVLGAMAYFGGPVRPGLAVAAGVSAAIVEALAPRGTDNVALPLAVWAVLRAGVALGASQ